MNYRETLDYLYSRLPAYQRIGKAAYKDNLDNTIALDNYFGNPHHKFRTIHVAGTNGKGSVSHMMASVLSEAGYKTGLYTSPHLWDFRERIKINGVMIGEEEVISFVEKHRSIIEEVSPSFFEMTVAMAFSHFAASGVDVAVIETGMGGRLDSTNIVSPILSVITNIGHDHMEFLGDSLAKVAGEKAGIIKPGIPVVIGESKSETDGAFTEVANRNNSPVFFADRLLSCTLGRFDPASAGREFTVAGPEPGDRLSGVIPLSGDYQARNLVTLVQSLRVIGTDLGISDNHILTGIANTVTSTGLLGRWQILGREPLVICDTAHNREGLEWVMKQLNEQKYSDLHIVLGVVNDKDLSSVLPLFPTGARYYFTRASIPRALDENILMNEAAKYGLTGTSYADVPSAYRAALGSARKDDLVFVGGSTFVVAEVV